eukprot:m.220952 g.220952  ORF g.220952 m.220952 type:complete len:286 (+) comp18714_c1_seq2:60-917(+)
MADQRDRAAVQYTDLAFASPSTNRVRGGDGGGSRHTGRVVYTPVRTQRRQMLGGSDDRARPGSKAASAVASPFGGGHSDRLLQDGGRRSSAWQTPTGTTRGNTAAATPREQQVGSPQQPSAEREDQRRQERSTTASQLRYHVLTSGRGRDEDNWLQLVQNWERGSVTMTDLELLQRFHDRLPDVLDHALDPTKPAAHCCETLLCELQRIDPDIQSWVCHATRAFRDGRPGVLPPRIHVSTIEAASLSGLSQRGENEEETAPPGLVCCSPQLQLLLTSTLNSIIVN